MDTDDDKEFEVGEWIICNLWTSTTDRRRANLAKLIQVSKSHHRCNHPHWNGWYSADLSIKIPKNIRELDEASIRLWAALTYGSEVLDFDVGATPIPPSNET